MNVEQVKGEDMPFSDPERRRKETERFIRRPGRCKIVQREELKKLAEFYSCENTGLRKGNSQ